MDEMHGWVADYIGIPFKSGGRDRGGLDCYGLLRLVMAERYGYRMPLLSGDYTDALSVAETAPLFLREVPVICGSPLEGPQEGALAIMCVRGLPCHIGVWCGGGCILHARRGAGVVAERIDSPRLPGRIVGWYRVSEDYRAAEPVQPGAQGVGVREPEHRADSRKN